MTTMNMNNTNGNDDKQPKELLDSHSQQCARHLRQLIHNELMDQLQLNMEFLLLTAEEEEFETSIEECLSLEVEQEEDFLHSSHKLTLELKHQTVDDDLMNQLHSSLGELLLLTNDDESDEADYKDTDDEDEVLVEEAEATITISSSSSPSEMTVTSESGALAGLLGNLSLNNNRRSSHCSFFSSTTKHQPQRYSFHQKEGLFCQQQLPSVIGGSLTNDKYVVVPQLKMERRANQAA